MSELKKCPFCGVSDGWIGLHVAFYDPYYRYRVKCQACGAEAGHGYSYEADESIKQGIHLWNTRPIEEVQAKEIAELKAKVAELEAENQRMREALRIVKLTFETYVSVHKLKPKSAENDIKIERNQEMVETCENALKGGE